MSNNKTLNIIGVVLSFILALFAGDKIQAVSIATDAVEKVVNITIDKVAPANNDVEIEGKQ
jgi:hypothetical protein